MFCGNCGNPFRESDQFCERCGFAKQNINPDIDYQEVSDTNKLNAGQTSSSSVSSGGRKRKKSILIILCLVFGIAYFVVCNRVVAILDQPYLGPSPTPLTLVATPAVTAFPDATYTSTSTTCTTVL